MQVPILAGKSSLSVGIARDVEDSGRELFAPFGCSLDDSGDGDLVQPLPRIGKKDDPDFLRFIGVGSRGL